MKVRNKSDISDEVMFSELKIGEPFVDRGKLCIKTNWPRAVALETGEELNPPMGREVKLPEYCEVIFKL